MFLPKKKYSVVNCDTRHLHNLPVTSADPVDAPYTSKVMTCFLLKLSQGNSSKRPMRLSLKENNESLKGSSMSNHFFFTQN